MKGGAVRTSTIPETILVPPLTETPAEDQLDPHAVWAREAAAAKRRALEDLLAFHIKTWGLPAPEREHRFDPVRRWRLDFAWPAFMVAAEVDGGQWTQGRHVRGTGIEQDAEKSAAAAVLGWQLLHFTSKQVRSAFAVRIVEKVLEHAAQRAARP